MASVQPEGPSDAPGTAGSQPPAATTPRRIIRPASSGMLEIQTADADEDAAVPVVEGAQAREGGRSTWLKPLVPKLPRGSEPADSSRPGSLGVPVRLSCLSDTRTASDGAGQRVQRKSSSAAATLAAVRGEPAAPARRDAVDDASLTSHPSPGEGGDPAAAGLVGKLQRSTSHPLRSVLQRITSVGRPPKGKPRRRIQTGCHSSLLANLYVTKNEVEISKARVYCGDTVISVDVSPDNGMFVAGGNNREALVYSTRDGSPIAKLQAKSGITKVLFMRHLDETYVVIGTFGGVIRIYDTNTHRELATHTWDRAETPISAMSISKDGRMLAVGGATSDFVLFSVTRVEPSMANSPVLSDKAEGPTPRQSGAAAARTSGGGGTTRSTPLQLSACSPSPPGVPLPLTLPGEPLTPPGSAASERSPGALAAPSIGVRMMRPSDVASTPRGGLGLGLGTPTAGRKNSGGSAVADSPGPVAQGFKAGGGAASSESSAASAAGDEPEREWSFTIEECGRSQHTGNVQGIELENESEFVVVAGEAKMVEVYAIEPPRPMPPSPLDSPVPNHSGSGIGGLPARFSLRTSQTCQQGAAAAAGPGARASGGGRDSSHEPSPFGSPHIPRSPIGNFCMSPLRAARRQQKWPTQAEEADSRHSLLLRCRFATSSTVHSIALARDKPSLAEHAGVKTVRSTLAVGLATHTELWVIVWQRLVDGRTLLRWDCEPLATIDAPAISGGVAFSADASRLAVAGNERVSLHAIHDGAVLKVYTLASRVRCVALSSSGSHVVFGGFDRHVTLYKTSAGAEVMRFPSPARGDIVRSVHKLSRMIAIAGESNGTGFALVYHMDRRRDHARDRRWTLPRPVWCARLTLDGTYCAVGGYDGCVHVYELKTGHEVGTVKYATPDGPPAFVWSCCWAASGRRLAVGCWNGSAYVYDLAEQKRANAQPTADGGGGAGADGAAAVKTTPTIGGKHIVGVGPDYELRFDEACVVKRKDRVYAVALDRDGTRLAVGGRDKAVAMVDVASGAVLWEVRDADFVYTVSVAEDCTRVAFGGMSKRVTALDGGSGERIFEQPTGGTVWCVALNADGSRLTVGGELTFVSVMETDTGAQVLVLPTYEPVYDVQLGVSSLCYASGDQGMLYGKGGFSYGWHEGPSYEVAASIVRNPQTSDEQRLAYLRVMLAQHPTMVNAADRGSRVSLLKLLIESTSDPAILDLALSVNTKIGLMTDEDGLSALDSALEGMSRKSIRKMLHAVERGAISRAPGSIEQVMRLFAPLALAFPHELLRFVTHMPLEPEPEVLGDAARTDNLMLPQVLVAGSMERSPRGVWDLELRRMVAANAAAGGPGAEGGVGGVGRSQRQSNTTSTPKGGGGGSDDGKPPSASPLSEQLRSSLRSPRAGVLSDVGRSPTPSDVGSVAADGGIAPSAAPASAASLMRHVLRSRSGPAPKWHVPGGVFEARSILGSIFPELMDGFGDAPRRTLAEARRMSVHVPLHSGFTAKSGAAGLSALRVPLPNLAGAAYSDPSTAKSSSTTTHLELIVTAAVRAGDYAVFDSKIVHALMDYKWRAFAGRQFHTQLFLYTCHMGVHFAYSASLRDLHHSAGELGQLGQRMLGNGEGVWEARAFILGWLWTTVHIFYVVYHESGQVRHSGVSDYFSDVWNMIDVMRIVCQMGTSTYAALIMLAPEHIAHVFDSESGWLLRFGAVDHSGHEHTCPSPDPLGRCLPEPPDLSEMAAPFAFDGEVLRPEVHVLLNMAGLSVILTLFKLFNYMRGFAHLGSLVQMIQAILIDMIPFMSILGVMVFGFSFALTIIPSGMRDYRVSLWSTINMGLYNNFDRDFFFHGGWYLWVLFQIFMLVVQVVLLNLLVAIMADSYRQVQARTKQAAKFERARVITEMESSPLVVSKLVRKLFGVEEPWVNEPRWLHILENEDNFDADDDNADDLF